MKRLFALFAIVSISSQAVFALSIAPIYTPIYNGNGDYDTNPVQPATCYNLSYNMRKGDKDSTVGGEVSKLQEAMNQLGYMSQDPTGFFGNATLNAVRSFQSANNLSATGYFGNLTRAALQSRTCGTINNPVYPTTTCALYTTYISNSCICPTGYYAAYTISGSSAFTCQNGTGYNPGNNTTISCNLNTIYTTNSCVCPSGYTAMTYGSGTFMCQSYNGGYNNNPNYNDCNYYGNCNYNNGNQYNNVCAVGENVQVDLSRCTCPSGYTAVQYQTFAYDGTQPGMCRYQGWYNY